MWLLKQGLDPVILRVLTWLVLGYYHVLKEEELETNIMHSGVYMATALRDIKYFMAFMA